jgi:hypothetical protein
LNAWFFVATVVYLVDLAVLRRFPGWNPLTRGLVALTPLLPGLLYVRDCLRFVRGMDELQRRIQLEAWLFAALAMVFITAVISTLSGQGVALGALRYGLDLGGIGCAMFALWLVGLVIANCRYK